MWVKYKIVAYDFAENIATSEGTQLYFVYQVIPEFPPVLILPMLIILTLLAVITCRKNLRASKKECFGNLFSTYIFSMLPENSL
jgi:hypothetical protein